jgi:hypothetical protein
VRARGRRALAPALLCAALAICASTATPTSIASWLRTAHEARTLNVTDEAHLHLVNATGSTYTEEGRATGALPGTVRARLDILGATISGTFTIYPSGGGSISGSGTARLHSTGLYASFGGSMSVGGGTGRYAHARGRGGLYGTVDRRSDALVIQTTGSLHY